MLTALCKLFQFSLDCGTLPSIWKVGHITGKITNTLLTRKDTLKAGIGKIPSVIVRLVLPAAFVS